MSLPYLVIDKLECSVHIYRVLWLAWVTDVRTWELTTDLLPTCAYGFLKHFWHAFTSRLQKKVIHSVHRFLFFSYNLQTNFLLFIQMQKLFTFHCTMSLWSQKMIFARTSNLKSVSTELVQAMNVDHNLEITLLHRRM